MQQQPSPGSLQARREGHPRRPGLVDQTTAGRHPGGPRWEDRSCWRGVLVAILGALVGVAAGAQGVAWAKISCTQSFSLILAGATGDSSSDPGDSQDDTGLDEVLSWEWKGTTRLVVFHDLDHARMDCPVSGQECHVGLGYAQ